MKQTTGILTVLIILSLSFSSFADGWRKDEKQILIYPDNPQQVKLINDLAISYDVLKENTLRAYVIPRELNLLKSVQIGYEIEIDDLNAAFEDFWQAKDAYHSYQDIIDLADSLEQEFPAICKKHIFGTSLGGRQMAALKISDNVLVDENEAEVMFDGGIHGDEIGGAENVIRFARDLCIGYGSDPEITGLIDNREIWLFLMVNPDGRENMSRYNNNGVDLNRDWSYMWDSWGGSSGPCSQEENKALRECMYNNQFVVHTTYHSGTEFVSCPWSYRAEQPPDWNHIIQLAGLYSSLSGYSFLEYGQGYNGMYAINGSSKDSNYGIMGSISWSIEISYSKQPPSSQIMMYYNYNYPSMIALIEYAGYGLEGTVSDAVTGDPIPAMVIVNDYLPTYNDPLIGDYHKYVLEGTYTMKVMANGYQTQEVSNIQVTTGSSTVIDFQLQPTGGQHAYRIGSCRIPGNNESDEGNTTAALGTPDGVHYSIGVSGWVVLDMQSPVPDLAGPDIRVVEDDASPEGFTCFAGTTIDGPWISLGTGNGTTEFDLATSGLSEAQFIRINDDGDGAYVAPDAGFDLDAVEVIEPVSGVYLAMTNYAIDDGNGNNNGNIDPGETIDLTVWLKNQGTVPADNTNGNLSTLSGYISFDTGSGSFGNILPGETSSFTFTLTADPLTPAGEQVTIGLDADANSGAYTNYFSMNFVVGQIPVLVIDLDVNHNSGPAIQAAVTNNGIAADYQTGFPTELNVYSSVFVCLGIYSNNHVLNASEGQVLANYLNNGGNLYMEGGDTWYYDSQTVVHSMFNINGTSDGTSDMSNITGQPGTFTEGMSFGYSGDNAWMDHINAFSPAFSILQNTSPAYGTGVAYDAGTYKTIGTSHEFGGLNDGTSPSTKTELMAAYLDFFGLINDSPEVLVDLKVFLEGPFAAGLMSNGLNVSGYLPLTQPYDQSPWNYNGTEEVTSIPNSTVIDWILVELRETPGDVTTATPATAIGFRAGLLLNDGTITDLDGISVLSFPVEVNNNLFAVIHHRNHLAVMNVSALVISDGEYAFDFTSSPTTIHGGQLAEKELQTGIWGMISGDANHDGEVCNKDKDDVWYTELNNTGYYDGDFDMNGQVEQADKTLFWFPNTGKGTCIVK